MSQIVYFTQGKKGLAAKTMFGKMVFPNRSSKLQEGFAKVEIISNKENYAFVDGENFSPSSYNEDDLFKLFVEYFDSISSLQKGLTKEGVEVLLMSSFYGESKIVIFSASEEKWIVLPMSTFELDEKVKRSFSWELLSELQPVLDNKELQDWRSIYAGRNWGVVPLFDEERINLKVPAWVSEGIYKGYLHFANLSSFHKPPYQLLEPLRADYLEQSPLIIKGWDYMTLSRFDKINLMVQVRNYNKRRLTWWKEQGLQLFAGEPQKLEALVQSLETSPLWKEV